jgi:hypothetical protein
MMDQDKTKLEELLIDHATGDLSEAGAAELHDLLERYPEVDVELFARLTGELAAAIAHSGPEESRLPDDLFDRVVAEGEALLGSATESDGRLIPSRRRPWVTWSGWIAAAAAAIGWFVALDRAAPLPDALSEPTLAEVRSGLIQREAAILPWDRTDDPAAARATGDLVWSDVEQAGVMRIAGLDPNDPSVSQYQLWIFDEDREERFPVDGGVFDVPSGENEVLVPIRAAVSVSRAALFAVTVEQPGGVVVSDRERVVLLAQAG